MKQRENFFKSQLRTLCTPGQPNTFNIVPDQWGPIYFVFCRLTPPHRLLYVISLYSKLTLYRGCGLAYPSEYHLN
jgi:hypothetical protein